MRKPLVTYLFLPLTHLCQSEFRLSLPRRQIMFAIMPNIFQIGYIVYRLLLSQHGNSLVCWRIYASLLFMSVCSYLLLPARIYLSLGPNTQWNMARSLFLELLGSKEAISHQLVIQKTGIVVSGHFWSSFLDNPFFHQQMTFWVIVRKEKL